MRLHPVAKLFPRMPEDEFEGLCADIKEHGVRQPILVHEGEILDGRHRWKACEQLGIVNRVVPDEDLHDEALAWARRLAAGPTVAYRYMKANLDRALRADLPACLAAEAEGTVRSAGTEDHRAAVAAFVEKRTPSFKGR